MTLIATKNIKKKKEEEKKDNFLFLHVSWKKGKNVLRKHKKSLVRKRGKRPGREVVKPISLYMTPSEVYRRTYSFAAVSLC